MKKIIIIFFVFSLTYILQSQDLSSSIYVGTGLGTNIGGAFGIGTETMLNNKALEYDFNN